MSEQAKATGTANEVTTVKLGELKMVGFPVNVAFKDGDFSQIGKTKQRFLERKGEIKHVVNPDEYWAPWYNCEVMFTYFYCLQVSELSDIPEGMMGFTIPESLYAAVKYEGPHPWEPDPYGLLAAYRQDNNVANREEGMIIEKFEFAKDCLPNREISIEIFTPVK
ncbi:GyrI-like domain-containing protein [Paenibacillus thermotolerans]|uniref:GyrI-like domain-containing protein n=1 Tax=Paenibacillus thermotolerans TaxID=3027807 RepID=UPI0023685A45|nr:MULTISPECIES: effector binding domain-containing protein [unclassified Paenibacillus]